MADADSIAGAISSSSATWTWSSPTPASPTTGPSRSCRSTRRASMNDVNWLGTIHTVWAALPACSSAGAATSWWSRPAAACAASRPRPSTTARRRRSAASPRRSATSCTAPACRSRPSTRARSRPRSTTTSSTTCPTGTGWTAARPPGRSASRWWRRWRSDQRELFYPPIVRLLRVVNGISPRLGDLMLRRILGRSVAPR